MRRRREGRIQWVACRLGTFISLVVLLSVFRNVSWARVTTLLGTLQGSAWLIALPFAMAQLTETCAWKLTFKELGCRVPYGALLRVRMACEGVAQTLPGGMLIAESLKPALLTSQCGLEASDSVCGAASRKLLLLVSQCVYFAVAALLGLPALLAVSRTSTLGQWLPSLVMAAWLVLVLCAVALALAMHRGDICRRILTALKRIPMKALRSAADRWQVGFLKTDVRIVDFCALGPRRLAQSTGLYLLTWCWEAIETALLLTLLGVKLDFRTLCLIEVCASMLRHVAFMVPAGLGVQDLGYAALLHIFGVPDWLGITATFTLLKRSKELLWSVVGYSLLATMRKSIQPRPASSDSEAADGLALTNAIQAVPSRGLLPNLDRRRQAA